MAVLAEAASPPGPEIGIMHWGVGLRGVGGGGGQTGRDCGRLRAWALGGAGGEGGGGFPSHILTLRGGLEGGGGRGGGGGSPLSVGGTSGSSRLVGVNSLGGEGFYITVNENDLEGTVAAYTEAIARDPDNARLYSSRATILMKLDRLAEALADAQKAKMLAEKYFSSSNASRRPSPPAAADGGTGGGGGGGGVKAWGVSSAGGGGEGGGGGLVGGLWSDRSKYAATILRTDSAIFKDKQRSVLTPTPPPVFHSIGPETGGGGGGSLALRPETLMREHLEPDVLKFLRVKVRVRCMAGFGETLWLTGNHPAIGGWAPSQVCILLLI